MPAEPRDICEPRALAGVNAFPICITSNALLNCAIENYQYTATENVPIAQSARVTSFIKVIISLIAKQ